MVETKLLITPRIHARLKENISVTLFSRKIRSFNSAILSDKFSILDVCQICGYSKFQLPVNQFPRDPYNAPPSVAASIVFPLIDIAWCHVLMSADIYSR